MIFGIKDEDFLDANKVKIIDGIAGAGKSSKIDMFFKDRDIPYLRTTSSNALKRDAEKRYPGTKCDTIAGGLFHTENGIFFADEKEIEYSHLVIDEILQTSARVIDFIEKYRGSINIIITTDTRQMLAAENSKYFLEKFQALTKSESTIYVRLMKTLRARTEETERLYNALYKEAEAGENCFKHFKGLFQSVNYSEVSVKGILTKGDIIITHTKAIEDYIYRTERLSQKYDAELIPKGMIARKPPKDFNNYPILSQLQAEKSKKINRYLQLAQVATPTRYQGQEIVAGQKLYYVIEKTSRITNREFYTVCTRCHDMKSLVIVYIDIPDNAPITTFFGKKVKQYKTLSVKGEEIPVQIIDGKKYATEKDIASLIGKHEAPEGFVYNADTVYIDGEKITNIRYQDKGEARKFTARSLADKEPYFNLSYMNAVYRILETRKVDRISYCHYANRKIKENFRYELDLHAAYPHIMAYERLPIDGAIYTTESKNKLNFYIYRGENFTPNCLITDELADMLPREDIEYVFSTDFVQGSKMGKFLLEKAYKSIEDKAEIKTVHYGYLQKKFLEENEAEMCYILSETYLRELFMVCVNAVQAAITYKMLQATQADGYICVDALHTDDPEKAVEMLKKDYPKYDFRITDKLSWDFQGEAPRTLDEFLQNRARYTLIKHVDFQSYPPLKSRRALRSEYERNRRKMHKMAQ